MDQLDSRSFLYYINLSFERMYLLLGKTPKFIHWSIGSDIFSIANKVESIQTIPSPSLDKKVNKKQ